MKKIILSSAIASILCVAASPSLAASGSIGNTLRVTGAIIDSATCTAVTGNAVILDSVNRDATLGSARKALEFTLDCGTNAVNNVKITFKSDNIAIGADNYKVFGNTSPAADAATGVGIILLKTDDTPIEPDVRYDIVTNSPAAAVAPTVINGQFKVGYHPLSAAVLPGAGPVFATIGFIVDYS